MIKIENFNDDLLGLKDFATQLEEFISIEHQYVEGSLVIALSASFGAGKTTFLNMWKSSLENREDGHFKPLVISLNAWESDYYGDPLFAIISELVNTVKKEGNSAENLVIAAKDFGWFATAVGNQIAAKLTGIDAIAAGDLAQTKKATRKGQDPLQPDSFSIFEDRKRAMRSLKDAIQKFVEGYGSQVLFLVDELDRCRPDYAITYLETIKHLFDSKGAVFILAADRHQLECSAKTAFGDGLKFDEYYRKFVHREISLPKISHDDYKKLAFKYVPYYLEKEGLRHCVVQIDAHRVENISELIAALELTPRQIQEVFRILGHIFETSEDNKGRLNWCLAVGSILMAALKVGHSDMFVRLGASSVQPKEAFDFLEKLLGEKQSDWWFTLLLTGDALRVKKEQQAEDIFKEVGLLKEGEDLERIARLSQWYSGWGHSSKNRFAEMREKIEQLSKWA